MVLQAGDVNAGTFDSFSELIPLAHQARAWVHVDGAMGLWCNAVPELRHLLAGAEAADSWATDGHKWLNVPYDSGYAFVADPEPHRASMTQQASYLVQGKDGRDQLDWTPEHSRRARAFATWAALRELGRSGVADLVLRCSRMAGELVTRIGALPNARAIRVSEINQGLVRFYDPAPGATEQDHDRRTDDGHRRHQRHRRGVLYQHDLAGDALHAGVGLELADGRERCRSRGSGGGAGQRRGRTRCRWVGSEVITPSAPAACSGSVSSTRRRPSGIIDSFQANVERKGPSARS